MCEESSLTVACAVEIDTQIAEVYAANHNCRIVKQLHETGDHDKFVWNVDATAHNICQMTAAKRINTFLASPPCPPFSKAGKAHGLRSVEANSELHMERASGTDPVGLLGEWITGPCGLEDSEMEICGYEVHWNPQVQLAPFGPIRQGRFLALLIQGHDCNQV